MSSLPKPAMAHSARTAFSLMIVKAVISLSGASAGPSISTVRAAVGAVAGATAGPLAARSWSRPKTPAMIAVSSVAPAAIRAAMIWGFQLPWSFCSSLRMDGGLYGSDWGDSIRGRAEGVNRVRRLLVTNPCG